VTVDSDSVNELFLTRVRAENRLIVKNSIPINYNKYSESISVENPAKLFMHLLAETFAENGIEFSGEIRINTSAGMYRSTDLQTLFTHRSPRLIDIINVINKRSHNLYAEQVLLTIAGEYGAVASARVGTKLVTSKLAAMGVPETEFRMKDGSGLARKNLISPRGTALLLRYMANHRYAKEFYNSLPIAGVDGTLRNRMLGTAAVAKTRAKTGYVGYARNLSGYVDAQNGERFIFSVLVNNYTVPTPAINLLQDRICATLAQFSR
jgi:D-alanyl-D-alanine carboxypeptidase/D-alanyl-D-alanine-endopeptidase (penicillin-binding protein 4)